MARTGAANFTFKMTGRITNTVHVDLGASASAALGDTIEMAFTSGTSASNIDRIWSDSGRTVSSGNDEDIDLFDFAGIDSGAGAALDNIGQSASFVEIVGLMVQNQSASAGNLVLGGETSAATWNVMLGPADTGTITLLPGMVFMVGGLADPGYAVADTTNHLLRVNASGGNITYDIHIFGRSA